MALDVMVRTFTGAVEGRSLHKALNRLCASASERGLPLMSGVDPIDNTVFNRRQVPRLIGELEALVPDLKADEAEAAREVIQLARQVQSSTHRYLMFNGD